MTDEHATPAPIGWADFQVCCPACDHLIPSNDDWDQATPDTFEPKPENRFLRCDEAHGGCGLFVEQPSIRVVLTYGGVA